MQHLVKYIRAVGAITLALSGATAITAAPAQALGPAMSSLEAMTITQAAARIECGTIVQVLGGDYYCKMFDNKWVRDRCEITNPRGPALWAFGSWGKCPQRYWLKSRGHGPADPPRQQLHGCLRIVTKRPPRYRLRSFCRPGTRFPVPR